MNKYNVVKISIFAVVFLVIVLLMEYSGTLYKIDNMFHVKKINEAKISLDETKNEISILKNEIIKYEDKIDTLKQDLDNLINETLLVNTNLSDLEIIVGKTDVRGPGIKIRVADNLSDDDFYNINDKIVHDFDVRIILNALNNAGAEAIAVNGKRIISSTEVICIGPVIRINGEAVAAPFIINAIGDPDTLMEEVVLSTESYAYEIKTDYGIDITAMKSNDINISKNYDKIEIKFAKLNEEGE